MDGPEGPTRDGTVIVVTRLNGPRFAVNPDLLQRVESTPDTILTLIDGTKYIVAESMEEITDLVVEYRAASWPAIDVAHTEQDAALGIGDRPAPPAALTVAPEGD